MSDEAHLQELMRLVPPPAQPLDAGSLSERASIIAAIEQELPNELFLLNSAYGSGEFRHGAFTVQLHSVYRPGFPMLVKWNRRIFEQEAVKSPDLYLAMFELGVCWLHENDEWGGRIFWNTVGPMEHWTIGLMHSLLSPTVQRFSLSLTGFLTDVFSNRLKPLGFPEHFDAVRFEVYPHPSEAR